MPAVAKDIEFKSDEELGQIGLKELNDEHQYKKTYLNRKRKKPLTEDEKNKIRAYIEKIKSYKASASEVNDELVGDAAEEANDQLDKAITASERQTQLLKSTKGKTIDIKKRIEERYCI